jgi:hypothetical protein
MKLGLGRRAASPWIQTAQSDRDGAQSLPHFGSGLRLGFYRLFVAAATDVPQANRLCLDGHARAALAQDLLQERSLG